MTQYGVTSLKSRMIYDSRGVPTIEVDIVLNDKFFGRYSVPSGASIGKREALELRDHDNRYFHGKGVAKALANIKEKIQPQIMGKKFICCADFDQLLIELDGTLNKSNLGANAILAVSLAFAHAVAHSQNKQFFEFVSAGGVCSMPVPMMNLINGGAHADNNINIQEFMIMPIGFDSFSQALRAGSEIFHSLKSILSQKGYSTSTGDEGGFAPNLTSDILALDLLMEATAKAGYKAGSEILFALDVAADNFYQDGEYILANEKLSSDDMLEYYEKLIKNYPLISIEDPFSEHDHIAWQKFSKLFRDKIQIVGDDLFVTNCGYLQQGIEAEIANGIIIKSNQIGTFTETLKTIKLATDNNYNAIISHRSGETEDILIAHLAVGSNVGQIKTGSISRSDRVAKYNELLRIEERLGDSGSFFGKKLLEKINI